MTGGGLRAVGVLLDDLCPPEDAPRTLFEAAAPESAALMAAMDAVNAKHGRGTLFPAAVGVGRRGWGQRADRHSPRYTTRLDELPRVRA